MQEERRARGDYATPLPAVLKFREPGSKEWAHPCVLLPGTHAAGAVMACITRAGATTRISLLPAAAAAGDARIRCTPPPAAGGPGSVAEAEVEAPSSRGASPLHLEVAAAQLQLCLWDDERRRLLGAATPGGPPGQEEGEEDGAATLGHELLCITLDGLLLQLQRSGAHGLPQDAGVAAGGGCPGPLVLYSASLAAAGLQCDSYLPAAEHPVLLAAPLHAPSKAAGAGGRPPFEAELQVRARVWVCARRCA